MKYAAEGAKMHWAPVIDENYWMIPMSGFSTKSAEKGPHKKQTHFVE